MTSVEHLASGRALRNLRRDGDRLVYMEDGERATHVKVLEIGRAARTLLDVEPQSSLGALDAEVYVARHDGVVCDGRGAPITRFAGAGEILLCDGPALVAIVGWSSGAKGCRYQVVEIRRDTGDVRVVGQADDARPLAAVGTAGVWTARFEVVARQPLDEVPSSGTDAMAELQIGVWILELEGAAGLELPCHDLTRLCPAGADALVVHGEKLLRVTSRGRVVTLWSGVVHADALTAWRDGVAWIDGGVLWGLDQGGEPRELWRTTALRGLTALGDDLVVVVDPETDAIRSALGRGEPRQLVRLRP